MNCLDTIVTIILIELAFNKTCEQDQAVTWQHGTQKRVIRLYFLIVLPQLTNPFCFNWVSSYVLNNFTQVELIEPAVTGTRNVLSACEKAKAKKVVVVSSAGAVAVNPKWPKDLPMTEESWSDLESCKAIKVSDQIVAANRYQIHKS